MQPEAAIKRAKRVKKIVTVSKKATVKRKTINHATEDRKERGLASHASSLITHTSLASTRASTGGIAVIDANLETLRNPYHIKYQTFRRWSSPCYVVDVGGQLDRITTI